MPLSEDGAWQLEGALETLLGLPRVALAGGDGHPWHGTVTISGVRAAGAEAEARRLAHWLRARAEVMPDSVQVGTRE